MVVFFIIGPSLVQRLGSAGAIALAAGAGVLAATAQALYALGAGGTTALLTLASGGLYATFGAQGSFVMAALCALVPPMTFRLRSVSPPTGKLPKSS